MYGSSEIKSTTMVIPWNTVPAQLLTENSLKFIGLPFFNTSFAWKPLIWITALEWEISVIAKSISLQLFFTISLILFLLDKINQVLGALQRILVSLSAVTLEFFLEISKPSILISSVLILDFL